MSCGIAKSQVAALSLFLLFGWNVHLEAQSVTSNDPDLELSSIEVPDKISKGIRLAPWAHSVVAGEGTLWIHDNRRVYKLDPDRGSFSEIQIEDWSAGKGMPGGASFTIGSGSIWAYLKSHGVEGVHRYDPSTGKCLAVVSLKKGTIGPMLVFGEGALWTFDNFHRTLQRIDPGSNQVTATTDLLKGTWWPGPVVADGFVWLMDGDKGLMKRFDPQSAVLRDEFQAGAPEVGFFRQPFEGGFYRFTVQDGAIWIANDKHGSDGTFVLTRFDAKTLQRIAKIESDSSGGQPVVWNGFVWFLTAGYAFNRISMQTNHGAGKLAIISQDNRRETGLLLRDDKSLWVVGSKTVIRIQAKKKDYDNK